MLYALERIGQLLDDPEIMSTRVRAHAAPNNLEGIGVAEAPRGTLLHHYKIDENGLIVWANLIIATGHNNLAMNRRCFRWRVTTWTVQSCKRGCSTGSRR